MHKVSCQNKSCINKDVIYYMPEATNPTKCGGCKSDLTPAKMSDKEYKEVFDYDPFAEIPIQ